MDLETVREIVGAEGLLEGSMAARFAVNGVAPILVAQPATRGAAAALIIRARDEGWSLVAYGGGTQIEMGHPPRRLDLVLSTARLNRVVDYQPDDMTVTVEPGLTLSALQELLATRGQYLPLNPPVPTRATVGGTVASAASGPWRAAHGTPRDWVIGCRVIGADGLEVRGGGQVVKNVAGYDLPKLYTGSFGTLGLLSEVTFKVMPQPAATIVCTVHTNTPGEVEALVEQVMDSDLQPSSIELQHDPQDGTPSWPIQLEFRHFPEAVEWQATRLAEIAKGLGLTTTRAWDELIADTLEAGVERTAFLPFLARLGTVTARTAALAAEAVELSAAEGGLVSASVGTGQVFVRGPGASLQLAEGLRARAKAAGATCVFPRLPAELIGKADPWGEIGPELALMRALKAKLDPTGVFSPGRFVGGI